MAQSGKAYFNGKTIEYLVATAAGGGHDYYGRLMARHMKPQLPGSNIIVRNVPGAGHLIGTNLIYVAKPNGLTIGTFSTGMVNTQIIGLHKGIRFDLTKMSWVGKQSTDSPALHHLTSQNRAIGSMECAGHLADVREDWLA
jgi:tripartite-type tricarboxylate transporter receptor subunit TctC